MTEYIEQIAGKISQIPNITDISSVVSDLNSVSQKDIKQTTTLIKQFQTEFAEFKTDFKYKEIENELSKVSEIYDSLNIIQAWIKEVGYLNRSIDNVYARLGESIDFDDVAEKVDIIYESIGALNNWAQKLDNIDNAMSGTESKISALTTSLSDAQNISNVITALKARFDNAISDELDLDDIASKTDIIYENMNFLNDWVNKIDNLSQHTEQIRTKVDEVNKTLENANKIVEGVPDVKDRLEQLAGELTTIIHSTKDDTDSYIYTLLDIESDFLKLHKTLDDKTQITEQNINDLSAKFAQLNDDISSISIRTNKLILTADDANKEFRTYLEDFRKTVKTFEQQREKINPELKFAMLEDRMNNISKLINANIETNKNINNAFVYLAEWIDGTGSVLNTISENIAHLMKANEEKASYSEPEETVRPEDISELKSLLTGIMVQLNTALTPDIDSINERVDNATSENEHNFTKLEEMLQEKVNQQARQINSLEERIGELNSKFDKLIDAMSDNTNIEIKDILNYIASQLTSTKELVINQNNTNTLVSQMNEKMNSFDNNINKIVSYIEEE
ncbi:hypothetical protein II906_12115 [bacterium]|nr:hypothetical protein [bacterium]